jgi:hypothetical protein
VVTNTTVETHRYVIDGETCEFRLRQDLPEDAVIVELVHLVSEAGGLDDVPADPPTFGQAQVVDAGAFPGTAYRAEVVVTPQATYVLTVYVGDQAPEASRSTVNRILSSLVIEPWG